MSKMKRLTGHESCEEILKTIAEGEQIYLSAIALGRILRTASTKKFSAEAVQQLADALERESVDYEDSKSDLIAEVLFELSTPEINGVLTQDRCLELIAALEPTKGR